MANDFQHLIDLQLDGIRTVTLKCPERDNAASAAAPELASTVHVRAPDASACIALPEDQTGQLTREGATFPMSILIGKARMTNINLASHAEDLPEAHFAICSASRQLQDLSALDAAHCDACLAGVVSTRPEGRARLQVFADETGPMVSPNV